MVAPVTPRVPDKVVPWVTPRVPEIEVFANVVAWATFNEPFTSKEYAGVDLKIPIPAAVIEKELTLPIGTPEMFGPWEVAESLDVFNQKSIAFPVWFVLILLCLDVIKCLQPPEWNWNAIRFEITAPLFKLRPPRISSWADGESVKIPTFEENVVTPVTPRVPDKVVPWVTPRVPVIEVVAKVVAPVTPRVPDKVVAPVTPRVPPILTFPVWDAPDIPYGKDAAVFPGPLNDPADILPSADILPFLSNEKACTIGAVPAALPK